MNPWSYYNQTAKGYDELHGEEQRLKVRAVILLLNPKPSWAILDVGCGTGLSMQEWPCKIIGIEPSKEMADIAIKKGFDVKIAPAEKIPFPDNHFDAVISITSAHHFKPEAYAEMARVSSRAVITFLAKSDIREHRKSLEKHWKVEKVVECAPDVILVCKKKSIVPHSTEGGKGFYNHAATPVL